MIISISGLLGSGKDTIADYLVSTHGFRRESWASALKDAVSVVFGWDRTMLEGKTNESRAWRETPDSWWSNRLGMTVIPRTVLQEWGTEVCRQGYHDDIWVASLENKLCTTNDNIVISDTRFENEWNAIKNIGGTTLRVLRGPNPEWVLEYLETGKTLEFANKYKNIHASEYSSVGLKYDHIIRNDGTIADLHSQIESIINF